MDPITEAKLYRPSRWQRFRCLIGWHRWWTDLHLKPWRYLCLWCGRTMGVHDARRTKNP